MSRLGLDARTGRGFARSWFEDRSRLPAGTELWMVVRPLTIVNSQCGKAREMERIATTRSGQSTGQRSTVVSATGSSRMPLTVHVSGADNMWSVQRAVPNAVSSLQTVFCPSSPGAPCRPPPGLDEVSQVEAISNAVMAQMLGMMVAFQAQISNLSAKVNVSPSSPMPMASSVVTESLIADG